MKKAILSLMLLSLTVGATQSYASSPQEDVQIQALQGEQNKISKQLQELNELESKLSKVQMHRGGVLIVGVLAGAASVYLSVLGGTMLRAGAIGTGTEKMISNTGFILLAGADAALAAGAIQSIRYFVIRSEDVARLRGQISTTKNQLRELQQMYDQQ